MTILRDFGPRHQAGPGAVAGAARADVDVAVVDDDPVMGALVKRILSMRGYSVTWFADGVTAVAALCLPTVSLRARLILLDVSMPGMGGFDVLRRLQRDGVLEHSRVIMLTASAFEQDVRQAIGLGATGYLAKPLDISVLLGRVYSVLRRNSGVIPLGEVR
jgi:DNA-binding response OmpR family regulator